ncbi:MAG: hypothetical protein HYV15_02100 [Elusimicrobia bacterium]|nr:hypothetical protein [Elusimicrobiota bacterium]
MLSIRRVPVLRFIYDETPEKAQRVETLLAQIHAEEGAPPPEPPSKLDAVASKAFRRRRSKRR